MDHVASFPPRNMPEGTARYAINVVFQSRIEAFAKSQGWDGKVHVLDLFREDRPDLLSAETTLFEPTIEGAAATAKKIIDTGLVFEGLAIITREIVFKNDTTGEVWWEPSGYWTFSHEFGLVDEGDLSRRGDAFYAQT